MTTIPQVQHGRMLTLDDGQCAWQCFANLHDRALPDPEKVRQIIPAGEPWHVEIMARTTEYDASGTKVSGRHTEDRQVLRVIGWALLEDGEVEPLFVEDPELDVTWPAKYRWMHHACGMDADPPGQTYSVVHHIALRPGEMPLEQQAPGGLT